MSDSNLIYTYSPYTGGVYKGNLADENFSKSYYFVANKIAKIKSQKTMVNLPKIASLKSETIPIETLKHSVEFSAALRDTLKSYAARKEMEEAVWKDGYSTSAMIAAKQLDYQHAAAIESDSISHIQLVPLIRDLIGKPPELYFLEMLYRTIPVSKLEARIPEQDARKAQLQLEPFEELELDKVRFAEEKFNLKHNDTPMLFASENRIRAEIDPMAIDVEESQRALREARNAMALLELTKLDGNVGGTPTFQLSDPTADNATGFPRAGNNPKEELTEFFLTHYKDKRSRIRATAWNPVDYQLYESNFYVHGFAPGRDVAASGVVQLAGIPDVTAVLDPLIPRGIIYAIDTQAALKGEGPFVTEFWREYKRNADAGVIRDYVQFLIPNPKRYGMKIQIENVTLGTEPQTLEDIEDLIGAPNANLLNRPAT